MGRNTLKLQLTGFNELLTKLDRLGGDLKPVIEDALTQAGETITEDTLEALGDSNLPAGGKYHGKNRNTENSAVRNPRVEWEGMTASIGVGFDFGKPGAGGYLISGTPKMKPDYALQAIYKKKKYMTNLQNDMKDIVNDAIIEKMEG